MSTDSTSGTLVPNRIDLVLSLMLQICPWCPYDKFPRERSLVRPVTLTVISEDAALIALCREALRDFSESSNWELRVETSCKFMPSDGICLIDYKAQQRPQIVIDTNRTEIRYFFLVRPKELEQFREAVPSARGNILLKPVSRAVLDAYFSSAISSSEASSLRAQRDELLQGLLEANLRLQQYDQQRTNYLARAVHEFRVPLTVERRTGISQRQPDRSVAPHAPRRRNHDAIDVHHARVEHRGATGTRTPVARRPH
jgi:hypothetical protein